MRRLLALARRSVFPEVVATLLCAGSIIAGISLIAHDTLRPQHPPPPWSEAFHFASPLAWSAAFVLSGIMAGAAVMLHRQVAAWPMMIMAGVWAAWSATLIIGTTRGGVPTAAVGSNVLVWLMALLAGLYALEARDGAR